MRDLERCAPSSDRSCDRLFIRHFCALSLQRASGTFAPAGSFPSVCREMRDARTRPTFRVGEALHEHCCCYRAMFAGLAVEYVFELVLLSEPVIDTPLQMTDPVFEAQGVGHGEHVLRVQSKMGD